jgi:hypothetical protein
LEPTFSQVRKSSTKPTAEFNVAELFRRSRCDADYEHVPLKADRLALKKNLGTHSEAVIAPNFHPDIRGRQVSGRSKTAIEPKH